MREEWVSLSFSFWSWLLFGLVYLDDLGWSPGYANRLEPLFLASVGLG
jgi:hypothetical protein